MKAKVQVKALVDLVDESGDNPEFFIPQGTILTVVSDEGDHWICRYATKTFPVNRHEAEPFKRPSRATIRKRMKAEREQNRRDKAAQVVADNPGADARTLAKAWLVAMYGEEYAADPSFAAVADASRYVMEEMGR